MAKCKICGKHGLFFKVNGAGLCKECETREAEKAARAAAEKAAREERLRRQKEAAAALDAIPKAEIHGDGPKLSKRSVMLAPEFKFSSVTAKTSGKKLGTFVAIDTETTGLKPASCSILEVGAVKFVDWEPVETFQALCKPSTKIPAEATAVNGITAEMVADGKPFWAILPDLQRFVEGYNLVGHNLEFDMAFLWHEGLSVDESIKLYDTFAIAKRMLKPERKASADGQFDVKDHKLGTLCDHYEIDQPAAHRALGDAYASGLLLKALFAEKIDA